MQNSMTTNDLQCSWQDSYFVLEQHRSKILLTPNQLESLLNWATHELKRRKDNNEI